MQHGEGSHLEIRTNGSSIDRKCIGGRWSQPQDGSAAHQERSDIQRSFSDRRNLSASRSQVVEGPEQQEDKRQGS